MELKEAGICGLFVVGGAVGFGAFGLNDVLSSDLRHINDVSYEERAEYMATVVAEFDEAFDTYNVESEEYYHTGVSTFSHRPASSMFVEHVRLTELASTQQVKEIRVYFDEDLFCQQAEMTMFTEKGWHYEFNLENHNGGVIERVTCRASTTPQLRPASVA